MKKGRDIKKKPSATADLLRIVFEIYAGTPECVQCKRTHVELHLVNDSWTCLKCL